MKLWRSPRSGSGASILAVLGIGLVAWFATAGEKSPSGALARRPEVVEVTSGVHTALGYGTSSISMIVGADGVVIVDAGQSEAHAERALAAFREIDARPVRALVLTHGHGDHVAGGHVFARDGAIEIWACRNFEAEQRTIASAGLTVNRVRTARQFGEPRRAIPGDEAAITGATVEKSPGVRPNRFVDATRSELSIGGIRLDLMPAPGESPDQLYVWLPEQRVVFAGDNFYAAFPNLYAIRGTPYRDVEAWVASLDAILAEKPAFLVSGHGPPVRGQEAVRRALTDYRDAIRSVFEQTIEGMNRGLTPDELVEVVRLPERLAQSRALAPSYGHPAWAVRSIFAGHLGWFDGNATSLFPLTPSEEARRIAELAGGEANLIARAQRALASGDAQWAAQLADLVLALEPEASDIALLKANALEALAEKTTNENAQRYYRAAAAELRDAAGLR